MSNSELFTLSLSILGVVLAFVSIILSYSIFVRNQQNYYRKFLRFIERKKRYFHRYFRLWRIDGEFVANYLLEDIRFFAEDFFVNFTGDGALKYQQYKTIMGIYRHIIHRLKKTRKTYRKAKKKGYQNIFIHVQLFDKIQTLNETYFNNKLKKDKMLKENNNVYTTLTFPYSEDKKTIDFQARKKPIFYSMGNDLDFKKNLYYIFTFRDKIEKKLEGEDLERSYFFISCSYRKDDQRVHPTFLSQKQRAKLKQKH